MKYSCRAFHKDYAIYKTTVDLKLLRRGQEVGVYNINKALNGQVSLSKEFSYLEEEIQEVFNETA